jgi:hypothetical protein
VAVSPGAEALVGRRVQLVFDGRDATPDLGDEGPVVAAVTAVDPDAQVGGPLLEATVEAPPLLKGLRLRAWARYEDEPLRSCLEGRAPTVNASIEAEGGRAVAGGLATLTALPHAPGTSA